MKQLLTLSFALIIATCAIAQPTPVGHLTIFSENGDKFFLILNGERQNNVAETNLRIEDLNQPYYNAKVIFEDKTLPEISKNYLAIGDAEGHFMDVTYKIKKDKKGTPKLNYFSMIPVQQGFIAPNNVTVIRYGQPTPPPTPVPTPTHTHIQTTTPSTTIVQQTTTTRTGTTENVNMNVGVPGVGLNVTINDPLLNGTTTTTTRTTTTTTTGYPEHTHQHQPPVNRGCNGNYPMSSSDFQSALQTISKQGFDETKLSTAKTIAGKQCLSTAQIVQICKAFGFEQSKLDFAKFAYARCTDQASYFKVNDVFDFSSSVDELNQHINNN